MKKIIFLFLGAILLFSCSSKKEITGKRQDVFFDLTKIQISAKKQNITISKPETFTNYYGDSSVLNKNIENYKVDDFNFKNFSISSKRLYVKNYYFSNPAIVDNITYSLDTKGNLIAEKNDEILWKTKITEENDFINYYGGKISFYNNTIFITSRINEILALDKEGNIKWRKKINAVPISTPVIENKTLYTITNDNKLYALNTEDGRIKWIHYGTNKDSAIFGSANPVIYKNYVIASYSSGELFILDKNTGETIFNTKLTGKYYLFSNFELTDIDTTPQIKNNILVATANNGITVGIDLINMKILWKQNLSSLTNILINDNFVYLMTTDNVLVNMNLKNGNINYFTQLPQYANQKKKKGIVYYKSIIFVNDKLFAFNNLKEYITINPKDGRIEKTEKLPFDFYDKPFSLNNRISGIAFKRKTLKVI
ncbi:MAG TPA: PQQ-binding-like beta-propeller repeat protein, partial [Rickettsiales bacterium]|nr:PQQ-binding-like beta-propeller repeat protein [Rickettsiales bacterium]